MKGYLLKIIVFLIPVILIACIMELMLRQIPNDYRNKKNFLDANSDSVEVLILGGSHSLFGLNPAFLKEKGFNASHVSQSPNFDLEILKKYGNNWSRLKYIILPVSYPSLFERLEKSIEAWRVKNYCIYYDMDVSNYFPYYTEVLSNTVETNVRRLYSYYCTESGNISCTELGWDSTYSYNSADRDLDKTGKAAAKLHTFSDDRYFDGMVLTLESIIIFAGKLNVQVILYTPPAYVSYTENLNHDQLSRTLTAVTSLANKHENCFYFNLLEDKSFTESDFHDADHLSKTGAEKLTLMLDSIIFNSSKH
jgi:hypothetical protein